MDLVEAINIAHVILVNQSDWFTRNSIEKYVYDPSEERFINNLSNTILLKANLYQTFNVLK